MKGGATVAPQGKRTMTDLFREFWWILFPMAAFAYTGWVQWLQYRRQKALLDVLKVYAEKGQEPPPSVTDALSRTENNGDWSHSASGVAGRYWLLAGLFGTLCAGFIWGGLDGRMDGGSGAFMIVGFVMGAVALWSLICAIVIQWRKPTP